MFGSKNSTDECYINEQTFECSNICSCSNLWICAYKHFKHLFWSPFKYLLSWSICACACTWPFYEKSAYNLFLGIFTTTFKTTRVASSKCKKIAFNQII